MPYISGESLGDVASNRAAYANIKGTGGFRGMDATPETHQRRAVSSGPMAAVLQQDTPTQTRRMAASSAKAVYTRDGVRRGVVSGGNEVNYDPFGTGGGIYNAPRRISAAAPGQALVYRRSNVSLLGEYGEFSEGPEYLGFSLGKIVKNIGNTVKKAAVDTGHAVGTVATSKVGQLALGTALAVTGVGAPAAAGIFAATKGAGNLIKPGGNLKGAVTGAAQGAVEGLAAASAGKIARAAIGKIKSSHASTGATATDAAIAAAPLVPAVLKMPSGLEVSDLPPISVIPSNPANDGLFPAVPQPAPIFPKAKRVAASDVNRGGAKLGAAKKVLDAGQKVNKKANQGADQIAALSSKLDSLSSAMDAAKKIGDAAGVDALSKVAEQVQSQISNAQNIAGGAESGMRQAGAAVEGATTGAVAGAGLSSVSDFISNNKPLVYGGGLVLAGVLAYAMTGPHGSSNGGTTRPRYYARPRSRR